MLGRGEYPSVVEFVWGFVVAVCALACAVVAYEVVAYVFVECVVVAVGIDFAEDVLQGAAVDEPAIIQINLLSPFSFFFFFYYVLV